jgi:hypothetical protein
MPEIRNLTNRLVSIRLNNGRTLHLPPRFLADKIEHALIMNNAEIKKLEERHVITVQEAEENEPPAPARAKGKSAPENPSKK